MDEDAAVQRGLGERIRDLRRSKGWTQDRLAAETGLHRNYVGGVERGERNPTVMAVARIARALEVPLPSLFESDAEDGA